MHTPEFEGYKLEYVNNYGGKNSQEVTCTHFDWMSYYEDGQRYVACRHCGAIWTVL